MIPRPGARVIVGLSGGVDSSVSALLLKQQGYDVSAIFMKNWNDDDGTEYCTALTDFMDAAAVAQRIGLELDSVNFASAYWDRVFAHFLQEYQQGRTPNPDILCNKEIKFRAFLDHALQQGADFIATGHYAQTAQRAGHTRLLRGLDPQKDQTYFLHAVSEPEFARTLFPIGHLNKAKVRQIARAAGLPTHDKKDSTGICFIGERRFRDFLERYIPAQPGRIITLDNEVVGEHNGLMFYTIGQRQGLGIGGDKRYSEAPWYVAEKRLHTRELVVVQGDHPALYASTLLTELPHWICNDYPPTGQITARIRYRQPDQPCTIEQTSEGLRVSFARPQRAVTPGQSIVFYQGDECLGGASIRGACDA